MPDEAPTPPYIEHGPLMTLREASKKTRRPIRVLQRWVKAGILPARYKQARWPYATLVTMADLVTIASRRRWGTRRTRPTRHTTEGGYDYVIRGQVATDSRQPED